MKKIKLLFFLAALVPFTGKAQLAFLFSAEGGYAGSTVKSAELPLFLASYNSYNGNTLTQQFALDQKAARGKYMHFLVGMGDAHTKMTLGFGRYLVKTPNNTALFANGEGRNIAVEFKDATTEVGVRFDANRFTAGFQFDMILRTVSIYSQYVFPDGSTSLAGEHQLNGVYTNFRLQVGTGLNLGYRILPHVYLVGKADYIFQTDKSHPEYHQFEDLQMFRDLPDYLPRDMNEYINNPTNGTGNSISNDFHGLRFGVGIQFSIDNNEEE